MSLHNLFFHRFGSALWLHDLDRKWVHTMFYGNSGTPLLYLK